MQRVIIFFFILGSIACSTENNTQREWSKKTVVIPTPHKLLERDGLFILDKDVKITADFSDSKQQALVSFAVNGLKRNTGYTLRVSDRYRTNEKANTITFVLEQGEALSQAYSIIVKPTAVIISASTISGLFYGFQTLIQLIQPDVSSQTLNIPALSISDYPQLPHRAISIEQVKYDIESWKSGFNLMASLKLNALLINSKSLATLDSSQFIELLSIAEEYRIKVVPFVSGFDFNQTTIEETLSLTGYPIVATDQQNYNQVTQQSVAEQTIFVTSNKLAYEPMINQGSEQQRIILLFEISLTEIADANTNQWLLTYEKIDKKIYQGVVLNLPTLSTEYLSSLALVSSLGWRALKSQDLEQTLNELDLFQP